MTVASAKTALDPKAENSANSPEDSTQEAESLRSLPLVARTAMLDTAPGEVATTSQMVKPVDKHTERRKPAQRNDEVSRNMQHSMDARNHPQQGEDDGKAGKHDDIDFAAEGTSVLVMVDFEEVCVQTEDDGSADEFGEAQAERDEAGENHGEVSLFVGLVVGATKAHRKKTSPHVRMCYF